VARIGNINTMRARSVISEVCRRFAIPDRARFDVMNVLIEYSSGDARYGHTLEDTMSQTEPGRRFARDYPQAAIMYRLENHAWHTGVHAAGVIVCNEPVSDYCTVGADGVAQIDKPASEALNLLKIDALGLRTLGVIQDSGVVDAETLYGLTLDDPEVFSIFNAKKYSGIFQFEGQSQRFVASEVLIDSFRKIDHVTALARPGPLGGGASQKYIARAAGREEVEYRHPSMAAYLAKTMGVVLYQEQVMRIVRELGDFSWDATTEIRKAMSGRKGKEYFDRRGAEFVAGAAKQGLSEKEAKDIWNEICAFGAWGMNASHTVSYGVISYWCAWMKRYHPLEYAAACLRNAKDDDQTLEILRELVAEGTPYTPFDIELSQVNWSVQEGRLVGGFMNLEGFGPAKSVAAVEARRLGTMTDKLKERIAKARVKFAELHPLHAAYGDMYSNPEAYGIRAGSRIVELAAAPESGDMLTLVQLVSKQLRDENEERRVARRNGKRYTGQTLFFDMNVIDDSSTPFIARIDRFQFERLGKKAAETLQTGDVMLIRGRRVPGFSMIKITRIKCLTNPAAFEVYE
jgi:DNA polymerase III alpha subunit